MPTTDVYFEREQLLRAYLRDRTNVQARNAFLEANRPLIRGVMNKHFHYIPEFHREDVEQEGWIGLTIALEKFKPQLKIQFSTYATLWIRQKAWRYLQNNIDTIRIPICRQEVYSLLVRLEALYQERFGDPPESDRQLAKFIGCDVEMIDFIRQTCAPAQTHSLDFKVGEDETPLAELVTSDNAVDPFQVLLESEPNANVGSDELNRAISRLTPAHRKTLALFNQNLTLREIGEEVGCSVEGVRHRMKAAVRHLRRQFGANEDLPISLLRSVKSSEDNTEDNDPRLNGIIVLFKRRLDEMNANSPAPNQTRRDQRPATTTATAPAPRPSPLVVPVTPSEFETAVVAYYLNGQDHNTPLENHPLVAKWGIVRRRLLANLSRLDNERVLIGLGVGTGRYRKGSCQTVVCRKPEGTTSEEVDILPQVFKGLRIKYGQPYDLSRYVANLQQRDTAPRPPGPEPPPPAEPKPAPAITAAPVPASPSNKLALPELRPNDADSIESAIAIRQEHLLKLNAYEAKLRELLASTRTCRRETQGEIAHLEATQKILTQPLKRPTL